MSIPEHLDVHYDDFPNVMEMIGEVRDVICKDDPRNLVGKFTVYGVDMYQQRPSTIYYMDNVPYIGQNAGIGNESEDPLLVGQLVIVKFLEGDPNRPCIVRPYFNKNHETAVAQTKEQHPRVKHVRNGVDLTIDKHGETILKLPEGKALTVVDRNGDQVLKVDEDGDVELGDGTLRRLVDERIVAAINGLSWTIPALAVSGTPPATAPGVTTGIVTPLVLDNVTTTKTKGS